MMIIGKSSWSNSWLQTEGRCNPLSSFMELLLLIISTPSIVLRSQYPCTDLTTHTIVGVTYHSCFCPINTNMALWRVDPNAIVGDTSVLCHPNFEGSLWFTRVDMITVATGIRYMTPLFLSFGSHDFTLIKFHFRAHAGVNTERMSRVAQILSNNSLTSWTQGVRRGSSGWESSVGGDGAALGWAWSVFLTSLGRNPLAWKTSSKECSSIDFIEGS